MEIELSFFSDLDPKYNEYENRYRDIAEFVFNYLKLDDYFIFEVNLVDANTIQEINKTYRNIDRVTDVISFAFEDEDDFKLLKGQNLPRDLGSISICVERAIEQAIEYMHSFEREMSFLFIHGLLHLLGYDHIEQDDEKIMFKLQDEILNALEIRR